MPPTPNYRKERFAQRIARMIGHLQHGEIIIVRQLQPEKRWRITRTIDGSLSKRRAVDRAIFEALAKRNIIERVAYDENERGFRAEWRLRQQ